MIRRTYILGSRGSLLALWQAEWVKKQLQKLVPGIQIEIKKITTTGDKFRNLTWTEIPGKGVFIKEIEEALLAKEIDFAVHSLKDVPTELPDRLHLATITKREDAHDMIIFNSRSRITLPKRKNKEPSPLLDVLPEGAKIGTSSLRRQSQLLHFRPDLVMLDLRGNLITRIAKLEQGDYDAIVVAAAGLNRLKITGKIMVPIPFEFMLPAVGQGALAIECRKEDRKVNQLVKKLNNNKTELTITAERAFLAGLGGGCRMPIAAYSRIEQKKLRLYGLVATPDGTKLIRNKAETETLTLAGAESLGKMLAHELLSAGAERLLNPRS